MILLSLEEINELRLMIHRPRLVVKVLDIQMDDSLYCVTILYNHLKIELSYIDLEDVAALFYCNLSEVAHNHVRILINNHIDLFEEIYEDFAPIELDLTLPPWNLKDD